MALWFGAVCRRVWLCLWCGKGPVDGGDSIGVGQDGQGMRKEG